MLVWAHECHKDYMLLPTKDGKNLYFHRGISSSKQIRKGSASFFRMYQKCGKWEKVEIPNEHKDELLSEKSLILKGYL